MNKLFSSCLTIIFFSLVLGISSIVHSALSVDGTGVLSVSKKGDRVELAVVTHSKIPLGALRPIISIGEHTSRLRKLSNDDNEKKIIFLMSSEQFEKTIDGSAVTVKYGFKAWNCGVINKKLLR